MSKSSRRRRAYRQRKAAREGRPWLFTSPAEGHPSRHVTVYKDFSTVSAGPAVRFLSSSNQDRSLWREALSFVALAKLGEIFGLLAELRYWAALGALPAPFDKLGITPLGQLGADVWPWCEICDGHGNECADCNECWPCVFCNREGKTGEPTRVDATLAVLSDWRMEHGKTWAEVFPRLTVLGYRCDRSDYDCCRVAEPRGVFCAQCREEIAARMVPDGLAPSRPVELRPVLFGCPAAREEALLGDYVEEWITNRVAEHHPPEGRWVIVRRERTNDPNYAYGVWHGRVVDVPHGVDLPAWARERLARGETVMLRPRRDAGASNGLTLRDLMDEARRRSGVW